MPRKIAAGNWKMNGTAADLAELEALAATIPPAPPDVLLCVPATLLAQASSRAPATITIGAQDCHAAANGAHTGDISAAMIAATGARAVILGHSERRTDHGETDADVRAKIEAAWAAGLTAILCLGETEAQRDAGDTLTVITGQHAASLPDGANAQNTIIAYEPIWAIGTGKVPTPAQIAEAHDTLRAKSPDTSLLYGGSVKASNAAEIFQIPNVDGALVGGASLKATDFAPIVTALAQA